MNKLLVTAVAGIFSSATILGGGVAAGDETAFIVPGSAPSPYGPLRALYRFNTADQPAIGANYYNSASANRVIVPYPRELLAGHRIGFTDCGRVCGYRDEQSRLLAP